MQANDTECGNKIVIWGLGKEFSVWRTMLESEELGVTVMGYCDKDNEKRQAFSNAVAPSSLSLFQPDLILTSFNLCNEIVMELQKAGLNNVKVLSFGEFIVSRLKVHEKAVGNGMHMYRYCREVIERTDLKVSSIMEIGANYGQDAEFLRLFWGVDNDHVYTFEANERISKKIDRRYKYHNYNLAVSDYTGKIVLNLVDIEEENSGLSSVKKYSYTEDWAREEVDCICMKDFMDKHKEIDTIDFLKVDVEGVDYEVLKGFGHYLDKVKIIQTEAENLVDYEGEHYLFTDIARLLMNFGFELITYDLARLQSDSLWIKRDLLKKGKFQV